MPVISNTQLFLTTLQQAADEAENAGDTELAIQILNLRILVLQRASGSGSN